MSDKRNSYAKAKLTRATRRFVIPADFSPRQHIPVREKTLQSQQLNSIIHVNPTIIPNNRHVIIIGVVKAVNRHVSKIVNITSMRLLRSQAISNIQDQKRIHVLISYEKYSNIHRFRNLLANDHSQL